MKKYLPYLFVTVLVAVFGFIGLSGVASAHNDCQWNCHASPTPTPTPTPTPSCHKEDEHGHFGGGHFDNCVTPTPTPTQTPCLPKHESEDVWIPCVTPTPTVTPTGTPEVTPTPTETPNNNGGTGVSDGGSSNPGATQAPVCSDGTTTQLPANVFVERNGTQATINFFITEGDSANIYYKVDGHDSWEFSVPNITPNSDKFVSYTITGLDANTAYDFAVQQKQGCGGGQLAEAVVIDGPNGVYFPFSYWEWSK